MIEASKVRRLFIGLPVNSLRDTGLADIHNKLGKFGTALRIVPVKNFHITVKFLGGITTETADKISAAFAEADIPQGVIKAAAVGIGAFPDTDNPSVIYYALETDLSRLRDIHFRIGSFSTRFGFERDKRKFIPHLTAARVRRGARIPDELIGLIAAGRGATLAEFEISRVVLYESILSSKGAEYIELASLVL